MTEAVSASDEELALEAAQGRSSSFEELVGRYGGRLRHFLRQKVSSHQDAEDLVQETFLKACRNIDRFCPEYKFSTWIYTIAYRLAVSRYRTLKKTQVYIESDSSAPLPDEIVVQKDTARRIWAMARTLNVRYYEALWLRYAEEMSIREMSGVMKKSSTAVRVTLHRARLSLSKILEEDSDAAACLNGRSACQKVTIL